MDTLPRTDTAPVILFSSKALEYSLLSWQQEYSTEVHYLAIPERARRRNIPLGTGRKPIFHDELKRAGGVWTQVNTSKDGFSLMTYTQAFGGYIPPGRVMVVSAEGKIDYHTLDGNVMQFDNKNCVVLPVDMGSERQLESWITGMKGLPGDLCQAVLMGIVNQGLSSPERPARIPAFSDLETVPTVGARRGIPSWVWMVLTAFVGLLLGVVSVFTGVPGLYKASPSSPFAEYQIAPAAIGRPPRVPQIDVPASPSQEPIAFAKKLQEMEQILSKSKLPSVVELLKTSHIDEFPTSPELEPAKRNLEAWMIVRIVMLLQQPKQKEWADLNKVKAYAQNAIADNNSNDDTRPTIQAALCHGGVKMKNLACNNVDWQTAEHEFDSLVHAGEIPTGAGANGATKR